jgi:hypothetical protein
MYQTYRIDTFSEGSNAYITARTERWELVKDESFEDEVQAKSYVVEQSRRHTILPNFLLQNRDSRNEKINPGCKGEEMSEEDLIDAFCFSDSKYLKHRRFFVGKPNIKEIFSALKKDGVVATKI